MREEHSSRIKVKAEFITRIFKIHQHIRKIEKSVMVGLEDIKGENKDERILKKKASFS